MRALALLLAGWMLAAASAGAAPAAPPLRLEEVLVSVEALARDARAREAVLAVAAARPYRNFGEMRLELLGERDALRINAMARFFDVLLCDLDYAALNERMAIAYGAFQRASKADAIAQLEAEARYRELLARRNAMRDLQRTTRALLAVATSQRDRLSEDLAEPALAREAGPPPDLATLERAALAGSPRLVALRARRGPASAEVAALEIALRQSLLEAHLEIDRLDGVERDLVAMRGELAERRLDREREAYDAGKPNDFANALTGIVDARRDERALEYRLAVARARLAALAGQPPHAPTAK
jgi:hypothetical protein